MNSGLNRHIQDILLAKHRKKVWERIVAVLAVIVIVFTSMQLSSPADAVTQENSPVIEEHYSDVSAADIASDIADAQVVSLPEESAAEPESFEEAAAAESDVDATAAEYGFSDEVITAEPVPQVDAGLAEEAMADPASGESAEEAVESESIVTAPEEGELPSEINAEEGELTSEILPEGNGQPSEDTENAIAAGEDISVDAAANEDAPEVVTADEEIEETVPASLIYSQEPAELSGWITGVELEKSFPIERDEEGNVLVWSEWEKLLPTVLTEEDSEGESDADIGDGTFYIVNPEERIRFALNFSIEPGALVISENNPDNSSENDNEDPLASEIVSCSRIAYTLPQILAGAVSETAEVYSFLPAEGEEQTHRVIGTLTTDEGGRFPDGRAVITLPDSEVTANAIDNQYLDGELKLDIAAGDIVLPGEDREIIFREDYGEDGLPYIVAATIRCVEDVESDALNDTDATDGIQTVELAIASITPVDGSLLPQDVNDTAFAYIEDASEAELAAAEVEDFITAADEPVMMMKAGRRMTSVADAAVAEGTVILDGEEDAVDAADAANPVEEAAADATPENANQPIDGRRQYCVLNISLGMGEEELAEYEDGFYVNVTLPEAISGRDFRLYHLHDDGTLEIAELPVECYSAGEPDPETGNQTLEGFSFVTDNFSEFVLSYTVDFEYFVNGRVYDFSLPGGGSITLSELAEILNLIEGTDFASVDEFLSQVEYVSFSDESLVEITPTEGDWLLSSLQPFDSEESLTITMKNGNVITVKVTDARKPVLSNTYGRIKIVKEWYDAAGNRIEAPTLDDTYVSDFILTAYEYTPSDIVRLHFVDSSGNEDTTKTVIVPTGNLKITLYNTPESAGKGYLFSAKPSESNPINNPYDSINLLTDVAVQSEQITLDDGSQISRWVMNLDLNDYAGELTDVYLGIMPSDETTGISYFTQGTYPDRAVNVGSGTKAMDIAYTDSGRWAGDTYRNRHIWDTIKGTHNEYTLQNQDLELTSPGGSGTSTVGSFFGYSIVENNASANGAKNFTTTISWNNGADKVYSNGLTGWSPELYITSPNTQTTVVVKNRLRSNVDVPVEKHWDYMDQNDDVYDWEAKFVLQWAPLYEGEGTPSTEFVEVEPHQYITITEAMMDNFGNTFSERSFKNLPLYGEDENGPFRYEYSVEEESYTITSHTSGEVLATFNRHGAEGEKYTGSLPHFVPYYPHDAGELSANPSDYSVSVVNAEASSEENPTINITVNKLWEDENVMEDDTHGYHATVKVQRYDQQTTRKIQDYDSSARVEVKFFDENNHYVKSEYVEKGVQQRLHITWNSYGHDSSSLKISSSPNLVQFEENGHQCGQNMVIDSYSDWFYPVDQMEIHMDKNVWNENDQYNRAIAVNPKAGIELLDEQTSAEGVPDTVYNNDPADVFTLSLLNNRWSTIITGLPLVEYTIEGDTQTIHHYSYYFVEDQENTTPSGYSSSYVRYDTVGTEHEVELGDNKYRINYDGEHVTIINRKETLRVRKEWRGVAKNDWVLYPETIFDLYGTDDQNVINNAGEDGTLIKAGIHLNKTNNWEWMPEDETDGFTLPSYKYYYVKERTDLMAANAELGTPAWDNKYEIWMYYNENGVGRPEDPKKAATGSNGTITILNALHPENYLQIDLKKKWMEWGSPTSWDTTTGVYKRLHDLVMGFVVYRRVWDQPIEATSQYPSAHIISPGPMGWSDYGNEILVGYDSNGQRVLDDGGNTFELINGDGGNWHWTIKNQDDHGNTASDQIGLTSEGWYTKPDGEVVWAYYEYTVRETGIWKNLKKDPVDDPEISWFSNSVPICAWYKSSAQHNITEFNRDIGQDQDRLMNGQAFDMWVEKDWVDGAWDAREVYVKIYRRLQDGSKLEDFTAAIAQDISIGSLTGFVSSGDENMIDLNNKWIVFTPSRSRLYIDKVLRTHMNAAGTNPYDYWLVEVGYKDKHGNVHMYSGDGTDQRSVTDNDLLKMNPVYYAWDSTNGNWTSQANLTSQNNPNVGIVIGEKGTNQLKITNTPVRDFAVIKKWQNALGEDLPDSQTPASLDIKIKQVRTARIGLDDTVVKESYVNFGGSDTLKITKDNSSNRVVLKAETHPGNSDDSQRYAATVSNDDSIGKWALYISGLEEKYYDEAGNLWICTYKVEEQTTGIPDDFVTEVSYDGIIDRDNRNITISNVKMEGGMLKVIKQIAEGSDYDTEDPFTLTVTLKPPLKSGAAGEQGERENVFDLGSPEHPTHQVSDYIEIDEEDTILLGTPVTTIADDNTVTITMKLAGRGSFTIRDIKPGTTYEVAEDVSYAPGWRQQGEVGYSNSEKTIDRRQMDSATVTNEEVDTSLSIKKVFDGDLAESLTPEQKQRVTFTVTGPHNFEETFTYGVDVDENHVWNDGVHRGPYSWNNGVLTIDKIAAGTYTIKEEHHDPATIFGEPSASYKHTWSYQVNDGAAITDPNPDEAIAVVQEAQQTSVLITNTYEELKQGALKIKKIVKVNGKDATADQYSLVDGEYTFAITGPTAAEAEDQVTKYVKILVEDSKMTSYKVSDTDTAAAWAEAAVVPVTDADDPWAVVDELDEGDYIITEAATEGFTVSSITGGKMVSGQNDANTAARTITVHVTSGDTVAADPEAKAEYTNNRSLIDISVIKIDETTRNEAEPTKLENAGFKLWRLTIPEGGSEGRYTVYPDTDNCEKSTDKDGFLKFEGLPAGKYMLEETTPPPGYVKYQEMKIYFEVKADGTTIWTDESGTVITSQSKVSYVPADKTFTVGNTPGVELPSTGGPGTQWLHMIGFLLMLMAGAGFMAIQSNDRRKGAW